MEVRSFEFDVPLPSSAAVGSIPSVVSINTTPSVLAPGESIGQRASISVSFRDHPFPLAGSSFNSGTFFGKLRAHRRSLQGLPLRVIREVDGESTVHHYVIESISLSGGEMVSLTAKDVLKIADGDRAQAPKVSHGRLQFEIDELVTELTLIPAGIGNIEYPTSGKVAIGGSEIVSFTRAGDVMTIERAQSGTEPKSHDADESVQLVLIYTSQSPADIVYDLLLNYTAGIDAAWLPLADWKQDIDSYIGRLYSTEIGEPTSVKKLLDELMEQIGLVIWWDDVERKVRLKSLRPVTGARVIRTDEMMADSFSFQEQPNKRVSEIWTHFALRNPLARLDDTTNYRSTLVTVDPDADVDYNGQPAIRQIFSRWIAINNRPAASRVNAMQLARYRDPPRKFSFRLYLTSKAPALGQGLELGHWSLQDIDGELVTAPVQVTSIERDEDRFVIDAEEMLFRDFVDPNDPDSGSGSRIVIIDHDSYNINLRNLYESFYTPPEAGIVVVCIIEPGKKVGSTSAAVPAFDVGDWPEDVEVLLRIQGRIQGKGGQGTFGEGGPGGVALYTRYPVTVESEGGQIFGGGGGGGGGGDFGPAGGGGAGFNPGSGDPPGGTEVGGITGPPAGSGGYPGLDGSPGVNSPGAAGAAIDGVSFVTFENVGTILGPEIN